MKLNKFIFMLVVFITPNLWVSGCAAPPGTSFPAVSDSTPSPAVTAILPTPTSPPQPTPAATLALPTQPLPTLPVPIQSPATPTLIQVSPTLWLRVLSPLDNSLVRTDRIQVEGEAAQGSVLSINKEIILVDESEMFSVTIKLQEGINLVEIVASDIHGDEIPLVLVVSYQP